MDIWPTALTTLGPITLLALLLILLLARLSRRHKAVNNRPGLWLDREYRCPTCQAPMQPGWVMLGKGAIFSPRDRGAPGTFAHIGQALDNTMSFSLRPAANMAWHCPSCRMLLIDHSRLVKP